MDIKNGVIGIAVIILAISVAVYGIGTFFEKPVYEDFCNERVPMQRVNTSEQCEKMGGMWNSNSISASEEGEPGYCDVNYHCRQSYENALEKYSKIVFLIALPLGILVIVFGAMFFGLEAVGAGLMGGGVGVILYGVGGFWQFAQDWIKFLLSLVGLIIIICFAYWFNSKKFRKKK